MQPQAVDEHDRPTGRDDWGIACRGGDIVGVYRRGGDIVRIYRRGWDIVGIYRDVGDIVRGIALGIAWLRHLMLSRPQCWRAV